jgi:hypothetical protein
MDKLHDSKKYLSPFGEIESYCGLLVHCTLLLLFRFFCIVSFYIFAFLEPLAFYLNREGLLIYSVSVPGGFVSVH